MTNKLPNATAGMTFPRPKPDTPPSMVKKIGKPDVSEAQKKDIQFDQNSNELVAPKTDIAIIVAVPNEKDGVYSAFGLTRGLSKRFDLLGGVVNKSVI